MLGMMATVANPTMGQDSTPASTPMIEQPVVVGEMEITWTGEWEYHDASSIEDQATFILIDIEQGILQLVSYGAFEDELIEDPDAAIDVFTEAHFESAGAGTVEETATASLTTGRSGGSSPSIFRVCRFHS
jgi:hypothetical protein